MQIVKKQKALEPKTSKKTNSPTAEKKVFSIDNSSNRDIEEERKKAYNFENYICNISIIILTEAKTFVRKLNLFFYDINKQVKVNMGKKIKLGNSVTSIKSVKITPQVY